MMGRLGIDDVTPLVSRGCYPSKAVVAEPFTVRATVWREGHEAVAATVVWSGPDRVPRPGVRMECVDVGNDRWEATLIPDRPGPWTFRVDAWSDPWGTWRRTVESKLAVGLDAEALANDLESGARLLDRLARRHSRRATRPLLRRAAAALRDDSRDPAARVELALSEETRIVVDEEPLRELITRGRQHRVWVDRRRALFGSWYELFPRSTGGRDAQGLPVHGTFATAAKELPRIAEMGFDIVYLPPVHPIGEVNRKGPNNALAAGPGDVGSPWAVGSRLGGHDAIHPELGDEQDFAAYVEQAREVGMEVALDLALQCAPDHPWVREHPEWFTTRPDGSIAFAENPPKTYEDIYPLNFDNAPEPLYEALLAVVRHWTDLGVRIFRVDNPHTKPLSFWERLIEDVHRGAPDVLFLAEAFTRPAVLQGLAKAGFTQSYTYFTWRTSKAELIEYLNELVETSHFLRPNFFVNTPDILHESLQRGGPKAFAVRAALAATLSPSWGVYSGFELFESEPLRPGSEEYLDSEKYELRPRDFRGALAEGRSLQPWITWLNETRRRNPALQQLRSLRFHTVDDGLLAYTKTDPTSGDGVLCVVALAPSGPTKATVRIDMAALGLDPDARIAAVDEMTEETVELAATTRLTIDPSHAVARLFSWSVS